MRTILLIPILLLTLTLPASAQEKAPADPAGLLEQYLETTVATRYHELRRQILASGVAGRDAAMKRLKRSRELRDRAVLIELLGRFRGDQVVRLLARLARTEENETCRTYAINGLGSKGAGGVQALAELLRSDLDDRSKKAVVSALASSGQPAAVAALAKALTREARTPIGVDVVGVLPLLAPEVATRAFLKTLGRASEAVRAYMIFQLALLSEEMPADLRRTVETTISRARKGLLSDLDSKDPSRRSLAAVALGALRVRAAIPELKKICASRSVGIEQALWALLRIDAPAHAEIFHDFLDPSVPANFATAVALRGLAASGHPDAVEIASRHLASREDGVVVAAAESLVLLQATGSASQVAERLLQEGNRAEISALLLDTLARLHDPDVVYPLIRFLKNGRTSASLRRASLLALGRIPGPSAGRELLTLFEDRTLGAGDRNVVAGSLVRREGEGILDALVAGARAPDAALRSAILAGMRHPDAAVHVEPLLARLTGAAPEDAAAIRSMLGASGDPRALEALARMLGEASDSVRILAVIEALLSLGDPRAVEPLLPFIAAENHRIADSAAFVALSLAGPHDPRLAAQIDEQLPRWVTAARSPRATLALRILGLLRRGQGRPAALWAYENAADDGARSVALAALTDIGLDGAAAALLLDELKESEVGQALPLLKALLSARDRRIDQAALATCRKSAEPLLRAAAELYALRSGQATSVEALAESIDRLPAQGGTPSAGTDSLLIWLSGSHSDWTRAVSAPPWARIRSGRAGLPEVPLSWRVRRWIEAHEEQLVEQSRFGAALRAPNANLLRNYLERYPQGQFAAEARRLIDALPGG